MVTTVEGIYDEAMLVTLERTDRRAFLRVCRTAALTEYGVEQLATHDDWMVRKAVAANPNLSMTYPGRRAIEMLADDKRRPVRRSLIVQPFLSSRVFRVLSMGGYHTYKADDLAALAAHPCADPDWLSRTAKAEIKYEYEGSTLANRQRVLNAAAHPLLPDSAQVAVSMHTDWEVRAALWTNPSLTDEVRDVLAREFGDE